MNDDQLKIILDIAEKARIWNTPGHSAHRNCNCKHCIQLADAVDKLQIAEDAAGAVKYVHEEFVRGYTNGWNDYCSTGIRMHNTSTPQSEISGYSTGYFKASLSHQKTGMRPMWADHGFCPACGFENPMPLQPDGLCLVCKTCFKEKVE